MICADREMPEISNELFRKGAELIVVPNECTWDADGRSRDTQVLTTGGEEGIFLAEFDIEAIRKFRREEELRINNKLRFILNG